MTEEYGVSVAFIFGLMVVGAWLEGINGKHGFWDEMLVPFPLGVLGLLIVAERVIFQ